MRRRDEIMAYVATYAQKHDGNSPSLSEIAAAFQISRQVVYWHTLKLASERRVEWRDGKLCVVGAEYTPPLNVG